MIAEKFLTGAFDLGALSNSMLGGGVPETVTPAELEKEDNTNKYLILSLILVGGLFMGLIIYSKIK